MKKILVFIFICGALLLNAQYSVKRTFQTTLGVGISNYGFPISLGFDYGLFRDLSVGLGLDYRYSKETFTPYRIFGSNLNVNYHFNNLFKIYDEHWDLYAGGYFSYWLVTDNIKKISSDSSNIGFGGQVGIHYFFNRHFAINTELAAGRIGTKNFLRNESALVGNFKLGLTYKF